MLLTCYYIIIKILFIKDALVIKLRFTKVFKGVVKKILLNCDNIKYTSKPFSVTILFFFFFLNWPKAYCARHTSWNSYSTLVRKNQPGFTYVGWQAVR